MIRLIGVFIAAMLLLAGCVAKPPAKLSMSQMQDDFDYLTKTVQADFPADQVNRQVFGIDTQQTLARYRQQITGNETSQEFFRIVFHALLACKGNHLWVNPILGQQRTQLFFWTWLPDDIRMTNIDNGAIDITQVYIRAMARKFRTAPSVPLVYYNGDYYTKHPLLVNGKTCRQGMKLISVSGEPVNGITEKLQDLLDCYDFVNHKFYGSIFFPNVGDNFYMLLNQSELQFSFIDADNNVIQINEKDHIQPIAPRHSLLMTAPSVQFLPQSQILYIRLPAMDYASMKSITGELANFRHDADTKAVVIDVRNNVGGNDRVWISILSQLVKQPIRRPGQNAYRDTPGGRDFLQKIHDCPSVKSQTINFLKDESFLISDSSATIDPAANFFHLDVPIFILSRNIYSSSGNLISVAQANDFIISVGETNPVSLGCGGNPWFFALPNSRIIFSMSPSLDISNCNAAIDTLHNQMEVNVTMTLSQLLDLYNCEADDANIEQGLLHHDPYFLAAYQYLQNNRSIPERSVVREK